MKPDKLVLVVDDDPDIREAVAELLNDEGFPTVTASNGLQALDLLKSGLRPGLILLDLMMPIMDGLQFRTVQQASPELREVPVVIFSAHNNLREAEQAIRPAATLKKPIGIDALMEVVGRVLPQPEPVHP